MSPQELEAEDELAPERDHLPSVRPNEIGSAADFTQQAVAAEVLRVLMDSDARRAIFHRYIEEHDADDPYRATAFWQPKNNPDTIYPYLRCRFAQNVRDCDSGICFERKPASKFAGAAWAKLGEFVCEENLPTLADCNDDRAEWYRRWRKKGVPSEITEQTGLSTGYAEKVRSIACFGVDSAYGAIIFCIDSVRANAFSAPNLTGFGARLTEGSKKREHPFATLLRRVVAARLNNHRDFWTWWLQERPVGWKRVVLPFVPSGLASVAPNVPEVVALPLIAACGLIFVLLLGVVVPKNSDIQARWLPLRRPIEGFVAGWDNAWRCWLCSTFFFVLYVLFTSLTEPGTHKPSHPGLIAASTGMSALFSLLCSYQILKAYFCIDRFAESSGSTEIPREADLAIHGAGLISMALLVIGHLMSAFDRQVGFDASIVGPVLAHAGICVVALVRSTAHCLLVGRLDSRLIGAPGIVISLLYLDAILHAICTVSDPLLGVPLFAARLFLDALLFIVVIWTIRARAIERYLMHLTEVASIVPRSSLSNARRDAKRLASRQPSEAHG